MTLHIVEPPAAAGKLIQTTVKDFAARRKFRTAALSKTHPRSLGLTAPHAVYLLDLDDLIAGNALSSAKLTGWRYLVHDGERVIASAQAITDASGASYRFSDFNEGPFVRSMADTLAAAERLEEVENGTYEFRLLMTPAVYVVALWLQDAMAGKNLILPLKPAPHELATGRIYSESEFLTILRELGQRVLEFSEQAKEP